MTKNNARVRKKIQHGGWTKNPSKMIILLSMMLSMTMQAETAQGDHCLGKLETECLSKDMCIFDQTTTSCRQMTIDEAVQQQWNDILTNAGLPLTTFEAELGAVSQFWIQSDPWEKPETIQMHL